MPRIQIIDMKNAEGELLETYQAMLARPMPSAYRPPHGDAAGIQRAHSLDPALMRVAFATSGSHVVNSGLSWAERELIAAAASRTNECVY